jgi:hypothetical protein
MPGIASVTAVSQYGTLQHRYQLTEKWSQTTIFALYDSLCTASCLAKMESDTIFQRADSGGERIPSSAEFSTLPGGF